MASFRLTPDAMDVLDAIWSFIFKDNPDAADAVEEEIRSACAMLAQEPLIGRVRQDLTALPVRFWTIPKYPNYIVVYKPDSRPLEIIRVLHGMRDIKRMLGQSS
jgi:antitoxin ParD1/3/4